MKPQFSSNRIGSVLGAVNEGRLGHFHIAIEGKRLQSRQQFLEQDSHFREVGIVTQGHRRTHGFLCAKLARWLGK
jgi:hypothetical protein